MCIPTPPLPAAQPSLVPSMQAADNLQLGGPQRGAAQLGRLQLRLGGPVPLTQAPKPAVTPTIAATPPVTGVAATAGVPSFAQTGSGGSGSSGVASSLGSIRFGGQSSVGGFGGMPSLVGR